MTVWYKIYTLKMPMSFDMGLAKMAKTVKLVKKSCKKKSLLNTYAKCEPFVCQKTS